MPFKEDSSASGHDEPWIQWFCGLKGHEMFCEVERSYIEDGFNLYGLRACVSNFSDCLDLILDRIGPDDDSDDSHLTQSACTLYGLIHARYIITAHGLDAMYSKYASKEFGICPLVQCAGQPVLPVSLKDEMGADTVKVYCPKCSQVYHPPPVRSRAGTSSGVDGAAFGTTFPHLFLMTFANLVPDPLPMDSIYIPRVFGFRVHKPARMRFNASTSAIAPSTTTATAAPVSTATTNPNAIADKKGSDDDESKSTTVMETINNDDDNVANNNNNTSVDLATTPSLAATPSTTGAPQSSSVALSSTEAHTAADGAMGGRLLLEDDEEHDQKRAEQLLAANSNKRNRNEPILSSGAVTIPSNNIDTTETLKSATSSNNNGSPASTFLMENAAKRRRRGTSTAANPSH